MALRQTMNLSQSLVITPQLQQAIKLLQMSRMELESAVRSELEENPILEEAESALKEEDLQRTKEAANEVEHSETPDQQNIQDPQKQDEFEWESYIEANQKPPQSGMAGSEEIMNYENVITASQTLHDHLYWQVKMNGFSEEEERAADALIGAIDDDGYIKVPLEQIAEEEKVDLALLEDTLTLIHEFDPPGVGARDLQECLLIQAKHMEEDTHDLVTLIKNHVKDLEKKNYEAIAKALNRDVEDIVEICKIIYAMDPKPGRAFVSSDTHYVTPDVYVYKVGDDYVVSLNEDGLPRLKISNFYKNMLKGGKTTGDKTQDYIQEKLRSAVWLIKSIHQRQRTIYKVTESIVKHQREFFEKGSEHLKPMVLRDIANDIGMHESTVSRVTTAKYVHTPQGIYELKYFFNSGISSSDGDSLASESVKIKIKDLVAKEDPKNPLSDQKIVDLLKVEGIQIARRTVAKYRDVLKILPSSQRKKYF
ncbi:RNA polymerase factor sigma-54 [Bdellovibrio bacteriovorus]|uniref:RNA polymerase sigma-54 factor n=1 Tax=Bdellovibrio bacteriovorus (strain ATCC 15356 / DSM 50701 / NCIMB 9529 / HD100) TaxID=264462 RepID=Q6MPK9_BDEBA|nr:RNA polymerase factor sigma-54 [Bdellovibrio bacteriovorus]BEV67338.1 RNA polymerase sigma-54 factor [Bdellovibrio bacteriovorus]CAE78788.1 RNA polymerase sigma-54 factor [Bdellovibrio bacteriovorus HD100]